MSEEEFNKLLNGPLSHSMIPFRITRLAMALMHVVQETGEKGAEALREFCDAREAKDQSHDDKGG